MNENKKKKLMIIGAGGHGRVSADVAASMERYTHIAFLDDAIPEILSAYPRLGAVEDAGRYIGEYEFFVAIGNSRIRRRITEMLDNACADIATLVHPSAVLGTNVKIGRGSIAMPGTIVNNNARIGESVILNTGCSADHDCVIGDYCHISVGARLCGTVSVGEEVWIGAGATVINNISICDSCMIGAGAVVIRDIQARGTYVGVPAGLIGAE